jgi:transposase InsO family protein
VGHHQAARRTKGVWFHLYVIIDIYSRYNPFWLLSTTESAEEAEEFIDGAVAGNGAVPHTIHADRGTSMTSGSVSELLASLGIDRSHSRPRTSNDNPFSDYVEAQFKTLKYVHDFPKSFASFDDTYIFVEGFFNEYNHGSTPASAGTPPTSVHFGTADAIDEARQIT